MIRHEHVFDSLIVSNFLFVDSKKDSGVLVVCSAVTPTPFYSMRKFQS